MPYSYLIAVFTLCSVEYGGLSLWRLILMGSTILQFSYSGSCPNYLRKKEKLVQWTRYCLKNLILRYFMFIETPATVSWRYGQSKTAHSVCSNITKSSNCLCLESQPWVLVAKHDYITFRADGWHPVRHTTVANYNVYKVL